jgi:putative intracellular protease/amidase
MAAIRRQSYAEYLSAVDGFADRARAVVAAVENGTPLAECELAFRGYAADWEQLQRTCSPVVIAGPSNVAERAADLRGKLGLMADECDRLYKTYMQNPTRMQGGRFLHAQQAARDARSAFIAAAQANAYGRAALPPGTSSSSLSRRLPAWWRTVLHRAG